MPKLEPGQPVVFIGPMGCGKSNTIAWLLDDNGSAVIVDSKCHPDEWAKWGAAHGYVVSKDPEAISQHPKVVWQVNMQALLDVAGWRDPKRLGHQWTDGLTRIMKRGNTTVVFDELVHVLPAGRTHPCAIQIITQGRAWNLSAWGGSQYANRVETMIVRGAVHCFCFQLQPFDAKLIEEKRGLALPPEPLAPYGFHYHLTNTPEWVAYGAPELVM